MERVFDVRGMTCDHCRAAVAGEVAGVGGVRAVDVDLRTGRVRVEGDALDEAAIIAAIDEAGYEAAPA